MQRWNDGFKLIPGKTFYSAIFAVKDPNFHLSSKVCSVLKSSAKAHMFIFHNILGITLSLYVLCIQIGPSLRKYRTHAHIYIYIYVLRLRALKGKTDFIRFIRKWQLFGDFYTILSFPAFDIFGTCSNRYHFNTFRGKFGFRSRVKLSLGIVKNL